MLVYLAASWTRKTEIQTVAAELTAAGVSINSRWLDERAEPHLNQSVEEFRAERAIVDIQDVMAADTLVRFSDDLSTPTVPSKLATGARMFEMGLAWGAGKRIIIVGGHQCVFDYLPTGVTHVANVEELKRYLLTGNRYEH